MKKILILVTLLSSSAFAQYPQVNLAQCEGVLNGRAITADFYIDSKFYCGEESSYDVSVVVDEGNLPYLQQGKLSISEGRVSVTAQEGEFTVVFNDFAYPALGEAVLSMRVSPDEIRDIALKCENNNFEVDCN
jgi:hypothetical protein